MKIMSSIFKHSEAASSWVSPLLGVFRIWGCISMSNRAVSAAFTCIFALGGAVVGTMVGAMKGQTTETGFVRGAGIGAVAGAITAVQLLDSMAAGESLSKIALLTSLLNGKVFMEWVCPAMLKAYQWQISSLETTYRDISDLYDVNGVKGLANNIIRDLPHYKMDTEELRELRLELCCSICLQDFKGGECARKLPNCGHLFHLECIDKWLIRSGTCPVCRNNICPDSEIEL